MRVPISISISPSICTTLLIGIVIIALATSTVQVSAFPGNTNNVCDVNTPITVHRSLNTGAATRLQLSSTSIAPGDSVTVTLSGTIRGFVLYAANAAGAHKGVLTNNANSAACETAPAGSDTGSTIRHKNGNTKQNQQFNWKAPTQPGVYTFYALVTEASGSAPVYRLPVASVTVTAPAPVVTQAPTQPPPVITQPPVVDPPAQPQPEPVATLPPPVIVVITQPPIITDPIDPTDPPVNEPDTPIPVIPTTQKPPITGTTTTTAPPSTGTDRIIPSKGATRPFDAATVALHATPKTDCWTSLNNVIYDISGLFGRHPGGDSTLSGYCGADCSDIFTSIHSTAAADLAKMEANYRIGVLAVITDQPAVTQAPVAGPGKGVTPAAQGGGATSTTTKSGMSDSVYIGLIVGGLAIMAILVGGFIYWQKSKHSSTSIAPRV